MTTKATTHHATYSQCRDSGVDWLGEIPMSWAVAPLKYSARLNPSPTEVGKLPAETEVTFLPMEAVGEKGGLDTSRSKMLSDVSTGYTYCREGDVIVAKITPCFENGKGAVVENVTNGLAFGTTELHVLRSRHLDRRFLFYVTISQPFRKLGEAEMYGAGGQKRVPTSFVEDYPQPIPPRFEQQAIATFLDRETAKIDRLIEKKQLLIERLEEKRTALISQAVTKGLDPNVPMKDSGVEWLSKLPAGWDLIPLKFIATIQTGLTLGRRNNEDIELTTRPYLRVANVQDGYLDLADLKDIQLPASDVDRYELNSGDVLMTEGGDFDKLGRGHVWQGEVENCLHQNHIFAVRPGQDRLNSFFMAYLLSSDHGKAYFTSTSKQSTNLASTNQTILKALPVLLPPLYEQKQIVLYLDKMNTRLKVVQRKVEDAIDRLQEYRTALISAAVTGKIDVRGEVEMNEVA